MYSKNDKNLNVININDGNNNSSNITEVLLL